jgi:lysylphosphatidylglycerol synthetase-like protein (DUF2156 family)
MLNLSAENLRNAVFAFPSTAGARSLILIASPCSPTILSIFSSLAELREGRPWELLIIAFYFFLPAICFLQTDYPARLSYNRAVRGEIAAVTVSHFLGWTAILFALVLVALFRHTWRSSASMQNLPDKSH